MPIPPDVYIQIGCYLFIIIAGIVFLSIWQRGFFWKYYKVKTSFGGKVLVKVRTSLRDEFEVGFVEEEMLVLKRHKKEKRVIMPTEFNPIYRAIGINWIDYDDSTNAIVKPDFSAVQSYDAVKFSNILTRALTQPQLQSNNEKIIMLTLFVIVILLCANAYLAYSNYDSVHKLAANIPEWLKNIKMTISGGGV